MTDERETWIRQFFHLALFTAAFNTLQSATSFLLWKATGSAALISFGLDAAVSAAAAVCLAASIQREWRNRFVALAYIAASAGAIYSAISTFWTARYPAGSLLGIVLAAVSMLIIPIVGSYMKTLAVELRSQALRSAAVFTFGNSYLSLVLLIALLLNVGMGLTWGDPLGALIMFPFIAQKGIQILLEEGKHEYVED